MASFSLSSCSDNSTLVSFQDIKLYHNIDRAIFARLVLKLRRDPGESMYVMALLLWLEHFPSYTGNLVYKIQTWPDSLIDALADEAVQCLNYLVTDNEFSSPIPNGTKNVIPLIRRLTRDELSPCFFRMHRFNIILGITQLIQDVCVTAFDDIVEEALGSTTPMATEHKYRIEQNLKPSLRFYYGPGPSVMPSLPDHNSEIEMEPSKDEMEELMEQIHNIRIKSMEENIEVPAENRTIFLTFSKGYPILENEVKSFFTRKFGENMIEKIEMQEVMAGEQALYAKLVLKSAADIDTILDGKHKAKFIINGKHVWSRKFVPRNNHFNACSN